MSNSSTGIGGPVERIHDDHQISFEILRTRLLRQDSDRQRSQDVEHHSIGHQVGSILAVTHT